MSKVHITALGLLSIMHQSSDFPGLGTEGDKRDSSPGGSVCLGDVVWNSGRSRLFRSFSETRICTKCKTTTRERSFRSQQNHLQVTPFRSSCFPFFFFLLFSFGKQERKR